MLAMALRLLPIAVMIKADGGNLGDLPAENDSAFRLPLGDQSFPSVPLAVAGLARAAVWGIQFETVLATLTRMPKKGSKVCPSELEEEPSSMRAHDGIEIGEFRVSLAAPRRPAGNRFRP